MLGDRDVRILVKGQARDAYLQLKKNDDKESKAILKSIERVKEILKKNPQFGDPIRKKLIPKQFHNLGIHNLYRTELSHFWRMLYTIEGNKVEILIFVLNIVDHPNYNKIFGYKKR